LFTHSMYTSRIMVLFYAQFNNVTAPHTKANAKESTKDRQRMPGHVRKPKPEDAEKPVWL